ncbi:centrosome-associated protein 350-like [Centruroides sculpturatus]|uniref:centrosome-associated protein 350-like n=1 Tax=Centruroides sculpturatus TaxID=218467 RepID=UPI000C6DD13E|nr:centrosome-associated protein 350-like [Centruroides sculpturatus]
MFQALLHQQENQTRLLEESRAEQRQLIQNTIAEAHAAISEKTLKIVEAQAQAVKSSADALLQLTENHHAAKKEFSSEYSNDFEQVETSNHYQSSGKSSEISSQSNSQSSNSSISEDLTVLPEKQNDTFSGNSNIESQSRSKNNELSKYTLSQLSKNTIEESVPESLEQGSITDEQKASISNPVHSSHEDHNLTNKSVQVPSISSHNQICKSVSTVSDMVCKPIIIINKHYIKLLSSQKIFFNLKLRQKGALEKVPSVRKRQRALLLQLHQERAQLRWLQEIHHKKTLGSQSSEENTSKIISGENEDHSLTPSASLISSEISQDEISKESLKENSDDIEEHIDLSEKSGLTQSEIKNTVIQETTNTAQENDNTENDLNISEDLEVLSEAAETLSSEKSSRSTETITDSSNKSGNKKDETQKSNAEISAQSLDDKKIKKENLVDDITENIFQWLYTDTVDTIKTRTLNQKIISNSENSSTEIVDKSKKKPSDFISENLSEYLIEDSVDCMLQITREKKDINISASESKNVKKDVSDITEKVTRILATLNDRKSVQSKSRPQDLMILSPLLDNLEDNNWEITTDLEIEKAEMTSSFEPVLLNQVDSDSHSEIPSVISSVYSSSDSANKNMEGVKSKISSKSSNSHVSTDIQSCKHSNQSLESLLQRFKKLENSKRYLTKREQKLLERRQEVENLLIWKQKLDAEENEIRGIEKKLFEMEKKQKSSSSISKSLHEDKKTTNSIKTEQSSKSSIQTDVEVSPGSSIESQGNNNRGKSESESSVAEDVIISEYQSQIISSNIQEEISTESKKQLSETEIYSESFESTDHSNIDSQLQNGTVPKQKYRGLNKKPPAMIRIPLVPHTHHRHDSSGSDDSFTVSQSETASDQSDIEGRILALSDELKRRQLEVSRLKKEQKRIYREQLKERELSLQKQIEAYDQYIQKAKKELEQKLEPSGTWYTSLETTPVKPQIKQPRVAESRRLRRNVANGDNLSPPSEVRIFSISIFVALVLF